MPKRSQKYSYETTKILEKLRAEASLEINEMAGYFEVSRDTVRDWELGYRSPHKTRRPDFIVYLLDKLKLRRNKERLQQIWEQVIVEEWAWQPLSKDELWKYNLLDNRQSDGHLANQVASEPKADWGTAPATTHFVGRADELDNLEQWVINERCRLVGLLGIGGVGKTWLAAALVKRVLPDFSKFIWRSLRDAPPLAEILNDYIHFLSDQQFPELPSSPDQRINVLVDLLRQQRCLLVLDNVESILKPGAGAGRFREGYESYRELLRAIGETDHQSCLIVTSRDTPAQLALLSSDRSPVRIWPLDGLDQQAASDLLEESNLHGSHEEMATLATHYSGNPLALQLVAGAIQALFDGKITDFVRVGIAFLGDVRNLLDEQFQRLSQEERDILYWLAILREPVISDELMVYMTPALPKHRLIETMQDLQRRSWIETGAGFGLQNVILEYLTERLVDKISDEIINLASERVKRHALVLAQSKYYIRNVQMRLLLQTVAQRLSELLGKAGAVERLLELKMSLQTGVTVDTGYAGANIIHLLAQLNQGDLRGQDFSKLVVRHAILQQNVDLNDVNFSHANLIDCSFTETFGYINDVVFSPDGQWLAISTINGIIRMWRIVQHGSNGSTTGLRYSFEQPRDLGQQLFSDAFNLNREKGKSVESITFHPSGEILASGHEDGPIHLWEAPSGRHLETLSGHIAWARSLAFDASGDILISGSEDCTVRLWDTHNRQVIGVLEGHTSPVYAIVFNHVTSMLASCSFDGTICLWNINSLRCLYVLDNPDAFEVRTLALNPQGSLLAGSTSRGTVCLWEVQTGKCIKKLHGHQHNVQSVRFSPNGDLLVSTSYDRSVRLWDVSTGECIKVLLGHRNPVNAAIFHPSEEILVSGSEDGSVRLWNQKTGQCLGVQQGYNNTIWTLAASPVENLLASGGSDGRILLWDLELRECHRTLLAFTYLVKTIAFSADGQFLASGSDDQIIRLWHTHTGECIQILHGHTERVLSLAFKPDGRILASGSIDKTVRLWDVASGYCLRVLDKFSDSVYSVVFNREGSMLITGTGDGKVQLWDVYTGGNLMTLEGQHARHIRSLALSRNGQLLASADDLSTVHLWDVDSGKCLATLDKSWAVVFHPQRDDMLFMLSQDRLTPQLVDIHHDEVVRSYLGAHDTLISLVISADGQLLIGAGDDGVIWLWGIESGECTKTLVPERPYERMNITGVRGLTETQKVSLKRLGAVEEAK